MGNSNTTTLEPITNQVQDRLTVLPDYIDKQTGDRIFKHKEQYDVCKAKNIGIDECKVYLRLKFILAKYQKWLLDGDTKNINNGMYTIINHELNANYNNTELLNDYHHLIFTHSYQFDDIFNYLHMNCKVSFCSSLIRVYRDRGNDDKHARHKLYLGLESTKEVNVMQILDKIHCHFLHTFEIGFDLTKQEMKQNEMKLPTDYFQTEQYIGYGDLHSELSSQEINDMFKENAEIAHLDCVLQDTKKLVDEKCKILEDYNVFGYEHKSNNKFSSELKPYEIQETNNDKERKYVFGKRYCYWDYYEDEAWYIPCKYEQLKDELLINPLQTVDIKQWNDLIEKAECYMNTKHCKTIMCTDARGRPYYGIGPREPISSQHLIALFVYCNFNRVQRAFTETYSRSNEKESVESLKERHSNFHNFGRLIREAVEVFGVNAYQSNINNFYHTIQHEMVLKYNAVYINSILSTTSKLCVALYYCADNDDSMILNLNSGSSFYYYSANYFDCKWLSAYSSDMECLFVGSSRPLYIKSILYPSWGFNYERYFNAFAIIKNMIRGLWFYSLNENDIVCNMFSRDSSIPQYILDVFNSFCDTVQSVDINNEAMHSDVLEGTFNGKKGYRFLDKIFFNEKDTEIIKFDEFCKIFPNLKTVWVQKAKLNDKLMGSILKFVENLKKNRNQTMKVINVYMCVQGIDDDELYKMDEAIEEYYQDFEDFNWKISIQSITNDILCFEKQRKTVLSAIW